MKRKNWRKIKIDLNSIKIYLLYTPKFSNFRVYVLRGCLRVFLTNSKVGIRGRRVVFFWLTLVYGPTISHLRRDFWVELQDLLGLTFPKWCVGGNFNVTRRILEKLGGSKITLNMREFDDFIRESELIGPPLRNVSFTWSNLQQIHVCKRLDRFLFSSEWE